MDLIPTIEDEDILPIADEDTDSEPDAPLNKADGRSAFRDDFQFEMNESVGFDWELDEAINMTSKVMIGT
jgi:hypothetical protein